MPISNVGGVLNAGTNAATPQNTIDQEDFIKLFLSQLQFQDPLEPVDNREFLTQMATFSSLEQARQTSVNTENALVMSASESALSMLGKWVELNNGTFGEVRAVDFPDDGYGPRLTLRETSGTNRTGVTLNVIKAIRDDSGNAPPGPEL